MLLVELAIGIAALFVLLTLFGVAIYIAFWVFMAFAILAGIGILFFNFPLEILITILCIVLVVICIFKGLILLGRAIRLRLSDKPPSPPTL